MGITSMEETPGTRSGEFSNSRVTKSSITRWLAVAALLFVVTGFCATLTWWYFRSLSGLEQRLVGTWRDKTSESTFSLNSDRTVSKGEHDFVGRWYASGSELYSSVGLFDETLQTLLRRERYPSIVTFVDDDHLTMFVPINGCTFEWERLGPPLK